MLKHFLKKRRVVFVIWCTNIEKVEIFHDLHDKVVVIMRRRSKWGTGNRRQKDFRKV